MAQTEKSHADVVALLADNNTQAISAQDVRDTFASGQGYGGMLLTVAGKPATMSNVSTSFVLLDIFNFVSAQSVDNNTNGVTATLSPTYRFTYTTGGFYHISFWASFSTSANNHLVTFRPHVDDVAGPVEVDRWVGTNTDTGVVAFDGIIEYAAGQFNDMRVAVDSGTIDLTFLAAGWNVFRVG